MCARSAISVMPALNSESSCSFLAGRFGAGAAPSGFSASGFARIEPPLLLSPLPPEAGARGEGSHQPPAPPQIPLRRQQGHEEQETDQQPGVPQRDQLIVR